MPESDIDDDEEKVKNSQLALLIHCQLTYCSENSGWLLVTMVRTCLSNHCLARIKHVQSLPRQILLQEEIIVYSLR